MKKLNYSAEIITIGTELLLGDVTDINTPFIARELRNLGIDVFRTVTVGDNIDRISRQINQSINAADIVIATGGLGPTIDDPTREAVSHTFGVDLVFVDNLWEQIKDRFKAFNHSPTENNRRQALLPIGAVPLENPVGTAPAFYIQHHGHMLICLPGVPSEVQYLMHATVMPLLSSRYETNAITITKVIRTAGMGESSIDDRIGNYEKLNNPTVGITAHPGQVDIRITAKAADAEIAMSLITPIQNEIEAILGDIVFGHDADTLENIVENLARSHNIDLFLFLPPDIKSNFSKLNLEESLLYMKEMDRNQFSRRISDGSLYNILNPKDIGVYVDWPSMESRKFSVSIFNNGKMDTQDFFFGGHEILFLEWMKTQILNTIRKNIGQVK